jgi:predicted MPP superfamily phosphohydrolase
MTIQRRRPQKPQHQFEVEQAMKTRPLELLMIRHKWVDHVLKNVGRAGLTALIWPYFVAPFRWKLRELPMLMRGLPASFSGYRILQFSDLHTGRTPVDYLERAIVAAQACKPDLIVITGDLIDYNKQGLIDLPRLLPLFKAPDGVIAVFGNHDYHEYSWRHVGERSAHRAIHKRLRKMIDASGVKLLLNQRAAVGHPDGVINIVGLDEMWVGHMDPEAAFAGLREGEPTLALQHNPDGYEKLARYPWQWMLCGHTHGGQVSIPLLGPLYVPSKHREWLRGIYQFENGRTMYVSTGLGYSGPRIRMRVPPEVTLFTLASAR